jgi:CheY-like chemotaxis protein
VASRLDTAGRVIAIRTAVAASMMTRDPGSRGSHFATVDDMKPTPDRPLIVLAEDNRELRGLFASALENVGYQIVPVETGTQLLATVRRLLRDGAPLRLIITDVRMPNAGGLEAARLLRAAGHAMPLIFMTAFGDAWTRAQAADLGAQLLDKPLSLVALRRAVTLTLAA